MEATISTASPLAVGRLQGRAERNSQVGHALLRAPRAQHLSKYERRAWRQRLLRATKAYATEDVAQTWREFLLSIALFLTAAAATLYFAAPLPKLLSMALLSLLHVRLFIFMHDAAHGAIFRTSTLGRALARGVGLLSFVTPRAWDDTHNRHHRTVAKPLTSELPSPLDSELATRSMTAIQWARLSPRQRFRARLVRHPLVILGAFVTVFALGQCVAPFLRNPKKYWLGPMFLLLWIAGFIVLGHCRGWTDSVCLLLLPQVLAGGLGGYIFHVQHSFPSSRISMPEKWHPIDASLEGASFFAMHPIMHWFTGNIGYHHVHHINHRIPFYRLPEAMAGISELQNPPRTSFSWHDIIGAFRANIWDDQVGEMISFTEADARANRQSLERETCVPRRAKSAGVVVGKRAP